MSPAPVLADSVGPGGTAAIVVFVLILACLVIFVGFLGSLKRLRRNASNGTFNIREQEENSQAASATKPARADDPVTRDPGGPGGAGV